MNLKLFFILAFLFIFTNIFSEDIYPRKVLISFKYEKQFKLASNQFAIWIENENGELIKNILLQDLLLLMVIQREKKLFQLG